jgi:hypothetical protein
MNQREGWEEEGELNDKKVMVHERHSIYIYYPIRR